MTAMADGGDRSTGRAVRPYAWTLTAVAISIDARAARTRSALAATRQSATAARLIGPHAANRHRARAAARGRNRALVRMHAY